jgi:FAD/FMN-containing dehydrogenase/Fe-S oxidoreductase
VTPERSFELLAKHLAASVAGEVRFDHVSRVLYSTDASIYQIMPIGVVIPRDAGDIATTIRLCREEGVPVLPRGAGTSLAGQTVGRAVVMDCSKYMNRILEIDTGRGVARVQPGVVQDVLNGALAPHRHRLGPDTATSNRATLGGMIGNNSSGARSIVYGKMVDHVVGLSVMLADGTEIALGPLDDAALAAKRAEASREGSLYRTTLDVADAHRAEIERRYPKVMRRVAGYNLPEMFLRPFNLARLFVGSEGTLGVTAEATVRIVPRPAHAVVAVVHFHDVFEALEAVNVILPHRPSAVELIDKMILEMTRGQIEFARRMTFIEGDPAAVQVVEFSGEDRDDVVGRMDAMARALASAKMGYAIVRAVDLPSQDNIWRVRKAGQGLLQGIKGDHKPITFVEDTAVPTERLAPYIRRFTEILERHGVRGAVYAHASVGVIHMRPYINLKDARQVETMRAIAEEVGELVIEFGGAFSAEHGDGMVRGWFLERFFGPTIYGAFKTIKAAYDPDNLMNPGKILASPPMTEHLRYGAAYRTIPVKTYFDWSRDGGMAANVEMCSGVGACRKTIEGTMCPSYMVTGEELHSTRGRANVLRAAMSGVLPAEALQGQAVHDALDLCLECKGCKAECPANVDMAKLKYEFLARYYDTHPVPARSRMFAHIHTLSRWGARFAPVSTWAAQSAMGRWALARVGVDPRRPLPAFATQTFDAWWREHRTSNGARQAAGGARGTAGAPARPRVALFADTFLRYNAPEIGRAAVRVLEHLGYDVVVPDVGCCGRPMISKGLLPQAKALAERNLAALLPLVRAGVPIVGCEPSCLLTFHDEVVDFIPGDDARTLAQHALLIDEFVHRHVQDHGWPGAPAPAAGRRLLFHGHCHQKAIAGTRAAMAVLRAAGFEVSDSDAGCCGMAGSFGFEREHYDISVAIGERRLLPAVRALAADAEVVAMGVSCRQQISHGAGRRARHLVEVLGDLLTST